jgi:hypothetical protein
MFGDVAVELLKLMSRSGTIPGALTSEDTPQALWSDPGPVDTSGL